MEKRLGIDVGTNSLGWAIVEVDDEGCTLLDRGVDIFQEGVAREKNQEKLPVPYGGTISVAVCAR